MAAGVTHVVLSGEHLVSNFRHGSVSVGLRVSATDLFVWFPDLGCQVPDSWEG